MVVADEDVPPTLEGSRTRQRPPHRGLRRSREPNFYRCVGLFRQTASGKLTAVPDSALR